MYQRVIWLCGVSLAFLSVVPACSTAGDKTTSGVRPHGNAGTTTTGSGGSGFIFGNNGGSGSGFNIDCDPSVPGSPCNPTTPAPAGCGDGMLADDEACDDGNRTDGDGCLGNCLATQPGYSCSPPGHPCHELVICGDKIVGSSEQCDDGNATAGDGCSPACKFEIGYKCEGQPSVCSATKCGDGKKEGAESCDDGNAVPFDGCSSTCQTEPKCDGTGCTSECGDGLLIDEECDDGNTKDGDGCSSACKKEGGFTCSQTAACEKINDKCILRVPVVYRDLTTKNPDVEPTCKGSGTDPGTAATPGLVNKTLTNGVPTAVTKATTGTEANGCITALDTWYSDKGAPAIVRDIVLFDNTKGGFVNRYGAMGEQWQGQATYLKSRFCGNGNTMCVANPPSFTGCAFDATVDTCLYPCPPNTGGGNTDTCAAQVTPGTAYDGNPLFFPLDDQKKDPNDPWIEAKIPKQYGYAWEWEDQIVPVLGAAHVEGKKTHNFHFTTQVTHWFKYDAKTTPRLDFTGDDDVWVFVNDKLALDLGGVHQPVDGTVNLNTTTAASLGLSDGKVYKLNIFHVERKKESSSFRLTLAGFDTAKSECTPICGDGIVSLGEQCDDGVNDGGYGECAPNCVIGPYCGDGIVQDAEPCDDGNRISGDGCSASCRVEVVK
jgi:fibro-slime domain-containing protein